MARPEGSTRSNREVTTMAVGQNDLALTVTAIRPMVPAKDFDTSKRFYEELGFRPETLSDELVEMHLAAYSFILQNYYVEQWANNFVIHMRVSDVNRWWDRIASLDLAKRYGVTVSAPRAESWGLVAGFVDPSGVLWRIAAPLTSNLK
jgi:catechol 2,3-dioxygenase-like lactoylglutathione lyase family enzyme